MLLYFTSRIISSAVAFLYPGYASFKTLSQRPASEEELERWLMYWSVLGCIIGVEYVAEWLVSWIPFYYPLKTLFLLYLALPQTHGSTYIYQSHLRPLLTTHESQIDAALAQLKTRVLAFLTDRLRSFWEILAASLYGGNGAAPGSAAGHGQGAGLGGFFGGEAAGAGAAPPPSMGDPVSGPAQMLGSLWRTYGPAIVAGGAALLKQAPPAGAGAAAQTQGSAEGDRAFMSPPSGPSRLGSTQSVLERKKQLEAELAALQNANIEGYDVGAGSDGGLEESGATLMPQAGEGSVRTRTSSSASDMRERAGARFEEVEVPSDEEGEQPGEMRERPGQSQGAQPARRTSWFGWGGAAPVEDDRSKRD